MPEAAESDTSPDLAVRIWGMADGHPFFQNAQARDLRAEGAILAGIEHPLQPQDIIGIQYGARKARFRVVGIQSSGPSPQIEANVELLSGQECPWKELAQTPPAPAELPDSDDDDNKRRFPRMRIPLPIELRDESGGAPMQTATADVSGRGCYVESRVPLPVGTKLALMFWLESEKITTSGLIRTSDPGVGMGIEFVGLDNPAKERLQSFLENQGAASKTAGADG